MKPTQKQPEPLKNVAVTREEIFGCERRPRLVRIALDLLNERDEALREVEQLKDMESFYKAELEHRKDELEAEKRHGAKVRRETLKEAAALFPCHKGCSCELDNVRRKILALTPRGPEKGRRKP